MKLFGIAIGINFHARSQRDAEAIAQQLLELVRNHEVQDSNGNTRDDGAGSVDSAEMSGAVEELE
jgi:hypothetical protein